MNHLALRDHANDILLATVEDMRSPQSVALQAAKAKGQAANDVSALNGASEQHAFGRLGSGFDLMEVVSEYRALRASVLRLWRASSPDQTEYDLADVTRFNESIDQSLTRAVSSYTRRVDQSRDLFLAMLSHDLRNPLNAIAISAALLPQLASSGTEALETVSQISDSTKVMARMISDLLDYTRTRLGAGMPLSATQMNLNEMCRNVVAEYRCSYSDRVILLNSETRLVGHWDPDRLRQMTSNLLGNAIQHGSQDRPVTITLHGTASEVTIEVHNAGPPIAPGDLMRVFDPLVQGSSAGQARANRPGSIGLGLYIAREIAFSHKGRIDVQSSLESGTSFSVHLPRNSQVRSEISALPS